LPSNTGPELSERELSEMPTPAIDVMSAETINSLLVFVIAQILVID
jgi:hypothetical protein